jgi:hypothetical protein
MKNISQLTPATPQIIMMINCFDIPKKYSGIDNQIAINKNINKLKINIPKNANKMTAFSKILFISPSPFQPPPVRRYAQDDRRP